MQFSDFLYVGASHRSYRHEKSMCCAIITEARNFPRYLSSFSYVWNLGFCLSNNVKYEGGIYFSVKLDNALINAGLSYLSFRLQWALTIVVTNCTC